MAGYGFGAEIATPDAGVRALLTSKSGNLAEYYFGQPTPTNSFPSGTKYPNITNGVDKLDLAFIPVNDLPSGGTSGRISPSEMFLTWTLFSGPVSYVRHRWVVNGVEVYQTQFSYGNPNDGIWLWSFIGHFDTAHPGPQGFVSDHNEIAGPATVYCYVDSDAGNAVFQFTATDSSLSSVRPTDIAIVDWYWDFTPGLHSPTLQRNTQHYLTLICKNTSAYIRNFYFKAQLMGAANSNVGQSAIWSTLAPGQSMQLSPILTVPALGGTYRLQTEMFVQNAPASLVTPQLDTVSVPVTLGVILVSGAWA